MAALPTTPTINHDTSSISIPSTPTGTPLAPGVQQRLILKQTAIDTWSLKEQLGLASAVLRSGDQNWVSVSRQMKPFSEDGRPPDWFSQKNCALQYNLLLGKVDTPRRKRGEKAVESVETPGEAIVRRLTSDRIKELRKVLEAETAELMRIEDECSLLNDENISVEKLREIELEIEKEEKEEAAKKQAHEQWLKDREEKKQAIQAALKAHSSKLPLKGAAAAAVMQAGAARRASSQSERSSFSDVDSPQPATQSTPSQPSVQDISSPVKKEEEISEPVEKKIEQPKITDESLPKSPKPVPQKTDESSSESQTEKETQVVKMEEEEAQSVEVEKEDKTPEESKETPSVAEKEQKVEEEPVINTENKIENDKTEEEAQNTVTEIKEEVEVSQEPEKESEEKTDDTPKEESAPQEPEPMETSDPLPPPPPASDPVSEPEESTPAPTKVKEEVDDEVDDEIIIKKVVETPKEVENKKTPPTTPTAMPKPMRTKKISEIVSEEEESVEDTSAKSKRDKRVKKLSERSEDTEESPGPPAAPSRATRRSKKMDSISENTPSEKEETLTGVENKRLSRIKETEGVTRGRRGSGTTANTSRSSSPVGSGDESEADQTPNRASRSRKKSGRPGNAGPETDSAPTSPSPGNVTPQETSSIDDPEVDEWKKSAFNIINDLKSHKFADKIFPILSQSSAETDVKPIVLKEMDLSIMKKNVETNVIKTNAELHHAIHLLFLNLVMSFGSDTEVCEKLIFYLSIFLGILHLILYF